MYVPTPSEEAQNNPSKITTVSDIHGNDISGYPESCILMENNLVLERFSHCSLGCIQFLTTFLCHL